MYNRNLINDSFANKVIRIADAISIRLRGFLYKNLNIFKYADNSSLRLGRKPQVKNGKRIFFKGYAYIGHNSRLEVIIDDYNQQYDLPRIDFGENCSFGNNFHCGAYKKISIGNNVLGGSNILITDHSHGRPSLDLKEKDITPPNKRKIHSKGEIIIEDNVWIADGVVILAGVVIGEGSIISANSVVRKSIPPRTIY